MNARELKMVSAIVASAVVGAGAVVLAATQGPQGGYSVTGPDMQTGVTETVTTAPTVPLTTKAEPGIKGPAPLPSEMQGLPG